MSQFTLPKLNRRELHSVRVDLDEEDFALLVRLCGETGLRNKTRFIRFLLWLWKAVEDTAWGKDGQPAWKAGGREPKLYLGILREVVGADGEPELMSDGKTTKKVARMVEIPDGWRKG